MTKGSDSVRQVHEFLDDVDWDLVQEAADLGAATLHYVRRHPWMLMAAGGLLGALGAWQAIENKRHHRNQGDTWSRHDPLDLMAP